MFVLGYWQVIDGTATGLIYYDCFKEKLVQEKLSPQMETFSGM